MDHTKTVLIDVPSPWEEGNAYTVRMVGAKLEKEADGGKWILVGTEMLVPRQQSPERKLLAIFRRGKG